MRPGRRRDGQAHDDLGTLTFTNALRTNSPTLHRLRRGMAPSPRARELGPLARTSARSLVPLPLRSEVISYDPPRRRSAMGYARCADQERAGSVKLVAW